LLIVDLFVSYNKKVSLETASSLVPLSLRAVVSSARENRVRQLSAVHSVACLARLCSSLRLCRSPLRPEVAPARLARMRRLLVRSVVPSLRVPSAVLVNKPQTNCVLPSFSQANKALILDLVSEMPPMLDQQSGAPLPEHQDKLALLAACFSDLVAARCLSLAVASVLLARALVKRAPMNALLSVQRLLVERTLLLPSPVWQPAADPFDQLVA
jgi:hypothetical protein